MDILKVWCGSTRTRATTTTMGPNNVRRVVWALGEFFFFISFVYWYLMNDASRYYRIQATARRRDPNDGVTVIWAPVSLHYRTRRHTHHHIPSPRRISNERTTKLGMSNRRGSRRVFFVYLIVLTINFISSF